MLNVPRDTYVHKMDPAGGVRDATVMVMLIPVIGIQAGAL